VDPLEETLSSKRKVDDLRFTKFSESHLTQPNPQETTFEDTAEVGAEGAGLSCPGSSEVAESHQDDPKASQLIKSRFGALFTRG
jgi:hypothetical protein